MSIQFLGITSINTLTKQEEVIYTQSVTRLNAGNSNGNTNTNINNNDSSDNIIIQDDFERDLFGYDIQEHLDESQGLLKHHFLLHSALEIMNHGLKPGHVSTATNSNKDNKTAETANTNANSMFRGLICVLDDYRFYGYVTNTAVKIIVAVKDDILPLEKELGEARDDMIRSLLVSVCMTVLHLFMICL
mmetsp:Transcript_4942/g.7532  ORF Transcript_4942/g.7532 Transcript_4942/m.7532 type:complete len:189 (+) Transcript_4942:203-769(+)